MDLAVKRKALADELAQCDSGATEAEKRAVALRERALFLRGAIAILNDQLNEAPPAPPAPETNG